MNEDVAGSGWAAFFKPREVREVPLEGREGRENELRRDFETLSAELAGDFELAPKQLDAMYIPGLSEGMVYSCGLFDLIAEEVALGRASLVLHSGSDGHGAFQGNQKPGGAWPGAEWYIRELTARGVRPEQLIPTGTEGIHTRAETDELAACAKRLGIRSVLIVTVPHHRARALSCLVGSMAKAEYAFQAYYAHPRTIDWEYQIAGSQGEKFQTLEEEAKSEVDRAVQYWIKGESNNTWKGAYGAPPELVYEYLSLRNGIKTEEEGFVF